ncbi:lectin [Stenotrophomonas sp. Iso1]|uniref:lectin n=1 Tax=Stenotrophomonas sp. Iso1 TaxID=2977283 RepID=UPI0022B7D68A|nr:lectin [Stenotrophomonas sp. Iso1]
MTRTALSLTVLVALLAACNRTPEPVAAPQTAPAPEAAPAPAPAAGTVATSDADWQGYGPAQLGVDAEQLVTAWGSELQGDAAADGGCYYLQPVGQGEGGVAFMIESGHFVRYDLRTADIAAPGGGKVGLDLAQLQALYPQAEAPQPHKYVEGGKVLRVPAADGSRGVLVFELGADGKASAWRVGVPPQVDYVEGCG